MSFVTIRDKHDVITQALHTNNFAAGKERDPLEAVEGKKLTLITYNVSVPYDSVIWRIPPKDSNNHINTITNAPNKETTAETAASKHQTIK